MANFYVRGKTTTPNYWQYCITNDIPLVELIPGRKYSKVNYDIYSMLGNHEIGEELMDEMNTIYTAYCKFFDLPKKYIAAVGGYYALIMTVHAEHGEFIAEQLYNYLVKYVRANRTPL